MKKLILAALVVFAAKLSAQTLIISDFTSLPGGSQFTTSGSWSLPDQLSVTDGFLTVGPVSPGSPDDSGNLAFADLVSAVNNGADFVTITAIARVDSGNASNGFIVNLFDDGGLGVLTATFAATSFTTGSFSSATASITRHPDNGSLNSILYYGIAGVGTTSAFRFSFDQLSMSTSAAIPEPSTYAMLAAGLLVVGFTVRRRMVRS